MGSSSIQDEDKYKKKEKIKRETKVMTTTKMKFGKRRIRRRKRRGGEQKKEIAGDKRSQFSEIHLLERKILLKISNKNTIIIFLKTLTENKDIYSSTPVQMTFHYHH